MARPRPPQDIRWAALTMLLLLALPAAAAPPQTAVHGMPTSRDATAVLHGQTAYLFGTGDDGTGQEIATLHTETLQKSVFGTELPRPMRGPSAVTHNGFLYLFGGWDTQSDQVLDTIYRINLQDGATDLMESRLPVPLWGTAAVFTGDLAIIWGGRPGPGEADRFHLLSYDTTQDELTHLYAGDGSVHGLSAVWNGRHAYAFGGLTVQGEPTDQIWWYDPQRQVVGSLETTLPEPRSHTAASYLEEHVYITGGYLANGAMTDRILRFDPATWTIANDTDRLPRPRADHAAVTNGAEAWILGGVAPDGIWSTALRYDPATPPATSAPRVFNEPQEYLNRLHWASETPIGIIDPPGGDTVPPNQDPGSTDLAIPLPVGLAIGAGVLTLGLIILAAASLRRANKPEPRTTPTPQQTGGALRLQSVTVAGAGRVLIDRINLEAPRGAVTVILGPSGSGKSTILKAIAGLTTYTGEIHVGRVNRRTDPANAKRLLGYVPQDLQLYNDLSVQENILYFAGQYDIPRRHARQHTDRLLTSLAMRPIAHRRLKDLSGGERRRASIAAALVHRPTYLLLDEPSAGLDFTARRNLTDHLLHLAHTDQIAVIVATHFIDEAAHADRVAILDHGRLVLYGTPHQLRWSLPGQGRLVNVEFDPLNTDQRGRLDALIQELRQDGACTWADVALFSARMLAQDPMRLSRTLNAQLHALGLPVRAMRLDEITLQDVFAYHTGRRITEAPP